MNHIFVTFTQDNFPSVNPPEKTGASMEKYLLPRQFNSIFFSLVWPWGKYTNLSTDETQSYVDMVMPRYKLSNCQNATHAFSLRCCKEWKCVGVFRDNIRIAQEVTISKSGHSYISIYYRPI